MLPCVYKETGGQYKHRYDIVVSMVQVHGISRENDVYTTDIRYGFN